MCTVGCGRLDRGYLFVEENGLRPIFGKSGDVTTKVAFASHPLHTLRPERQGLVELHRIPAAFHRLHILMREDQHQKTSKKHTH